jgi:phospholipid/cholesterol/gamma-HCH transport system ATP-binding protein
MLHWLHHPTPNTEGLDDLAARHGLAPPSADAPLPNIAPRATPAPAPGAGRLTPATPPEVRAEDVHKAFGDHHVLRGIDLTVTRGELVAIVGGSGSGKTVLLRHFLGFLNPDRGRVWVADHESPGSPLVDLATLDDNGMDRLRRHWAIVFQGNALFPGTVYENIALVLR